MHCMHVTRLFITKIDAENNYKRTTGSLIWENLGSPTSLIIHGLAQDVKVMQKIDLTGISSECSLTLHKLSFC